jgi:hypothetical protein
MIRSLGFDDISFRESEFDNVNFSSKPSAVDNDLGNLTEELAKGDVSRDPLINLIERDTIGALDSYLIKEEVNHSITEPGVAGTVGSLYKKSGFTNPAENDIFLNTESALKSVQGYTQITLERINSWSNNILHKVHSDVLNLQSEENVIRLSLINNLNLLSVLSNQAAYKNQSDLTKASGKVLTTIVNAVTELQQQSNGNQTQRVSAVYHVDAGKASFLTSSSYNIETPGFYTTTQQTLHQSRFYHLNTDLYQASHLEYWVRAENTLTTMADTSTYYAYNQLNVYAGSTAQYSGLRRVYADSINVQVGQLSFIPYKSSVENATNIPNYGSVSNVVMRDWRCETKTGIIGMRGGLGVVIDGPIVRINSSGLIGLLASLRRIPRIVVPLTEASSYNKRSESENTSSVVAINNIIQPPATPNNNLNNTTPPLVELTTDEQK